MAMAGRRLEPATRKASGYRSSFNESLPPMWGLHEGTGRRRADEDGAGGRAGPAPATSYLLPSSIGHLPRLCPLTHLGQTAEFKTSFV